MYFYFQAKRDNAKKTGAEGGKNKQLDEVDNAIFDIIQKDSVILDGLNLPESHEEIVTEIADVEVMINENSPKENRQKRRKLSQPPRPSDDNTEITKLKIELLKVEIYHRKLQSLKLERELGLLPSAITSDITQEEIGTILLAENENF